MARRITADWVRGFADRSCQIVTGRSPAIVLTATDDRTLRLVWGWLNSHNYRARVTSGGSNYTLRVSGLESLQQWRTQIGFFDREKLSILDEVLRVADPPVSESP